jgi:uncharacterized protein YecE (DUF72 family)
MPRVRTGCIRVGISGWRYASWRGVFYPKELRNKDELAHASTRFATIEINGTFYSLQRPELFAAWYAGTPEKFVFAVKGGRFITHMKKLRDVEIPLANFFASGVLRLREKLGPILWQFPADFAFDEARLDAFLRLLPRNTAEAAQLAGRHDHRVAGRSWMGPVPASRLRYAVEVRHRSFMTMRFVSLLRRHRVALVFADSADFPYFEDLTSDFVYLRLHGSEELYVSGYADVALARWAARISAWAAGKAPRDAIRIGATPSASVKSRDVYVYFDNDAKARAPFDATALMGHLSKGRALPDNCSDPSIPRSPVAGSRAPIQV